VYDKSGSLEGGSDDLSGSLDNPRPPAIVKDYQMPAVEQGLAD
jgi:hypothetical protein